MTSKTNCLKSFIRSVSFGSEIVMFLNKIEVPYCLVVFFVVYPRLRPVEGFSAS